MATRDTASDSVDSAPHTRRNGPPGVPFFIAAPETEPGGRHAPQYTSPSYA
ncbi:hypothetical protein [Archangium gephyra]|uniref:hypothetical protein n=1 Tax=Archangium gephyra TaxID=48 RepID=UPI003B9801D7